MATGRPQKNNLDYFSHDNGMRNDRKVKALRAKFGLEGYAIYNMILECISESDLLMLKWNDLEIELLSGDFNILSEALSQVVEYLCQINLIKCTNGYLFCPTLDERSKLVFSKRTKDLYTLRNNKGLSVTESMVSDTESTQSKVKESKVKKKEKIYKKEISIEERKMKFIEEVDEAIFKNPKAKSIRDAFIKHWTELNKSKTRMRFEGETYFELNKRFATFLNNDKQRTQNKSVYREEGKDYGNW
jgi:hypothetical protein